MPRGFNVDDAGSRRSAVRHAAGGGRSARGRPIRPAPSGCNREGSGSCDGEPRHQDRSERRSRTSDRSVARPSCTRPSMHRRGATSRSPVRCSGCSAGCSPRPESDNRRLRSTRGQTETQACPRPRRAAERVISPPPGRPPNFDVLRSLSPPPPPPDTPLPSPRVGSGRQVVRFWRNPRITAVLEHERRMRTAEGGLYPWCRATAPSSTSVEYRWSHHGPPPALRPVGAQPRRRHSGSHC